MEEFYVIDMINGNTFDVSPDWEFDGKKVAGFELPDATRCYAIKSVGNLPGITLQYLFLTRRSKLATATG